MISHKAVSLLEAEVLKRLPTLSDLQIMSVGTSLSSMEALSEQMFASLRRELWTRGQKLDDTLGTVKCSFQDVIPTVDVVHDSDGFVVINKIPGMVVSLTSDLKSTETERNKSPISGAPELQRIVSEHSPYPISSNPHFAHGILHRLDKDTSGALLIATRFNVFYDLRFQFACRKVIKRYSALVHGWLGRVGEPRSIDSSIITRKKHVNGFVMLRSETTDSYSGNSARTVVVPEVHYQSKEGLKFTYASIGIQTGRSHQIRVHLSSIGHPIVNDNKYGKIENDGRLFLHAKSLSFLYPCSDQPFHISTFLPDDLQAILDKLDIYDPPVS